MAGKERLANRVVVIGGGIVGLAVARELVARGNAVTVCEKENRWAAHQSGHNSNVAHAGLYYRPGSLKARASAAGNASMVRFAREHGLPVEVCGKLVVAASEAELPALATLADRAAANGVPVRNVSSAQAREYEPEVRCVAALRVSTTAVIDFPAVCAALAGDLRDAGADLRLRTPVLGIRPARIGNHRVELATPDGVLRADALVNCAGLQADRVAELAGLRPEARIVPFRGEYYELREQARSLVRGLIYPVPDAGLPFLGVHLTRMLDGTVHAGPNAVLALSREGYRWSELSAADLLDVARFPGIWRLGRRYARTGVAEVLRSLSRRRFAASVAKLVPAIGPDDLRRAGAGVRAQALRPDGSLVDDFLIQCAPGQAHVLNAPSPGATSSLEIARYVADRLAETVGR
ncbi:MAG TPA: L-2-hydroxyglutarate oxidase [Pseudonocardiaceae bacterium]